MRCRALVLSLTTVWHPFELHVGDDVACRAEGNSHVRRRRAPLVDPRAVPPRGRQDRNAGCYPWTPRVRCRLVGTRTSRVKPVVIYEG
jgi:hypothetical protein